MTPAAQDILATLRRLCGDRDRTLTTAEIAADAQCSTRTVLRALRVLVAAGLIRKRGEERQVQSFAVVTDGDRSCTMSPEFRRIYEDPADLTPGAEYTPLKDVEAVRADRARLMADTSWRPRTKWARGQSDAK